MRPNAALEQASVYRRWKRAWIIEESIVSMAFMRVVVIAKDGWWACLRSVHQPSPV